MVSAALTTMLGVSVYRAGFYKPSCHIIMAVTFLHPSPTLRNQIPGLFIIDNNVPEVFCHFKAPKASMPTFPPLLHSTF